MIVNLHFHEDTLIVTLSDGSEVRAPLSWHPRLRQGTDAERANWRLIGNGVGVHWPDLDEDIGVEGLVLGKRWRGSEVSLGGYRKTRPNPPRRNADRRVPYADGVEPERVGALHSCPRWKVASMNAN